MSPYTVVTFEVRKAPQNTDVWQRFDDSGFGHYTFIHLGHSIYRS